MAEDLGKSFEWDDEVIEDGADFKLVPPGEYDFFVSGLEKKNFKGSVKMAPCKYAELRLEIKNDQGEKIGEVKSNLYLNTNCIGIFSSFFRSIGQKKHGQPFVPRWNEVIGSVGRCKVSIRKYQKNDGSQGESNDVRFLDPAAGGKPAAAADWANEDAPF